MILIFFRGDYNRQEFKEFGTVSSLIFSNVHMMVTTATTSPPKKNVISILGLNNATIIMAPPGKPNVSRV